jgi:hypothetical protein
MLFNNTCRDILKVAEQMMLGELAYHRGDYDIAFDHLRRSVELDDGLPYDEPWGWMQPTRHALGALSAHYCLSRKDSRRRRQYTALTWASMTHLAEPANTPTTCGVCLVYMSA